MHRNALLWGLVALGCSFEQFTAVTQSDEPGSTGGERRPFVATPPDDGRVALQIEGPRGPVVGVVVIANDAEGRLLEQTLTDAQGVARVRPSASLSVLQQGRVTTVFGSVQRLLIDDLPAATDAVERAAMGLTVTAKTALPDTAPELVVDVPCGAAAPSPASVAFAGCAGESSYDVYGFGYAAGGAELAAYGVLLDLPFEAGASLSHEVAVNDLELVDHALRVAPVAGEVTAGSLLIVPRRAGRAAGPTLSAGLERVDSELRGAIRLPPLEYASYRIDAVLELAAPGPRRETGLRQVLAELPELWEWAPDDLAVFTGECAVNVSDGLHPGASWRLAPGRLGDAIEVEASWNEDAVRWLAMAEPAQAGSVRFPELPDGASELLPAPGTALDVLIRQVDVSGVDGFEQFVEDRLERAAGEQRWSAIEL